MHSPCGLAVFDFDGTLADSVDIALNLLNRFADEFGYRHISAEDMPLLRGKGSLEAVKFLRIPISRLLPLRQRVIHAMREEIDHIRPHPGIATALQALQARDISLAIVTSNAPENIRRFLHRHQITGFGTVEGCRRIFGKHHTLRRMARESKLPHHRIVYIGDETRDIEATRKAGIKAVAVAWGVQTAKTLAAARPDALALHPARLAETVRNILT